ncbi:MAG TPA: prenyltransferase [Nitrososphaera sp.]|nr:prenyltransferase [Nitrososphaera sp.]
MLNSWLRAIRIRFLLASVIAVSNGLAIAYWKTGQIDPVNALLTYVGVIFLHASVDLLNDYWDHKRGIDEMTTRTKFSGGTGVLPDKLLSPRAVYGAGIVFLILGGAIGAYFVVLKGFTIAVILGFAVVAIYFYSTSIVNAGLGELFVGIKGAMIVIGSYYVQSGQLDFAASLAGIIVGLLSATVLFVNSFPDYAADKSGGRRTLVIMIGKNRAAKTLPLFFVAAYCLVIAAVLTGHAKVYALVSLASIPLSILACRELWREWDNPNRIVKAMSRTVTYSRLTGSLLAISYLI